MSGLVLAFMDYHTMQSTFALLSFLECFWLVLVFVT